MSCNTKTMAKPSVKSTPGSSQSISQPKAKDMMRGDADLVEKEGKGKAGRHAMEHPRDV